MKGFEPSLLMPSVEDGFLGSANGLANILEHYAMPVMDLVKGQIRNYQNGKVHLANSNLTWEEVLQIAKAAKSSEFYDGYVQWTQGALEAAKSEGRSQKVIDTLSKMLASAKKLHDEKYMSFPMGKLERDFIHYYKVNDVPYFPSEKSKSQEIKFKKRQKVITNEFDNLLYNKHKYFDHYDFSQKAEFLLRRRTQQLCRNEFHRPAYLEAKLKCLWLHQNDPFLKLGPFKFEFLHRDPQITYVHDFVSDSEIENIKSMARGKMKSTPYQSGLKGTKAFSSLRTSKIMYVNEALEPNAMKISRKISQLTKFRLKDEYYASENYQIMNYGIGGRISLHTDSAGKLKFQRLPMSKGDRY